MTCPLSTDKPASWTWADLISTYSFWALLVLYLLSAVSTAMLNSYLPLFLVNRVGVQISASGMLFGLMSMGSLAGFYVAWLAARWKTIPMLIIAGLLQLLGGLLITVPALASTTISLWLGSFLLGLGSGAIMLAIPAVISGGRGGAEVFVISFGIVLALTRIGQLYAPALMGRFLTLYGYISLPVMMVICFLMEVLLLLGVKSSVFNAAPPQRGHPLPPTRRSPLNTALLCLIPFYWLYWLYRAHGEVTSMAPSRSILSPRAAVLAGIFIPFLIHPIILISLNDALNQQAVKPYRASWVIFLLSVVCLPAAIALIQSSMNEVMAGGDALQAAA